MHKKTLLLVVAITATITIGACKKGPGTIDKDKVAKAGINLKITSLIEEAEKSSDDNSRAKLLARASVLLVEKGDYKKAAQVARRAKRANPTEKDALATIAEYYLHQKKPAEAKIILTDLVASFPDYSRAHYLMGNAAMITGDVKGAEVYYKKAIVNNSSDVKAINNLAALYGALSKNADSLKLLKRAMILQPDYAPVYKNAGIAAEKLGKKSEAKKYYSRYIKLNSGGDDIAIVKSWREKL